MSYIGNQPTIGQYRKLDDISGSFNGSLTAFTMQVGSTNVSAGSAFQLLISLGGVIQEPGTDFTVSGSTITFTTAPAASLSFFGIMMGQPLNTATPGDSTVTGAKIVDGTITGGKLAAAFNYDSGLLFLDDTNNRVGVGTASPERNLSVGNGTNDIIVNLKSGTANFCLLDFGDSDNNAMGRIGYFNDQNVMTFRTNGSGEDVRIDSSGRLLVGTSTARANFNNSTDTTHFQVEGTDAATSSLSLVCNNGGGVPVASVHLAKSDGSSVGSNGAVGGSWNVGDIRFSGNDGAQFVEAARIEAEIDGTPAANDMPGRLIFSTTASGASTPTERMRIQSAGAIQFQNTSEFFCNPNNSSTLGRSANRWSAVWASNGTIQTSDERLKTEVTDSILATDFIKALRPVSYKWIEGGKRHTGEYDEDNNWVYESVPGQRTHWGFIAQEVKQAVDATGVDFGGWVLNDKDDPESTQSLRYDQFIAPLTKALQEAIAKIETLETANASLEARLTALEGSTP